MSANRSNPFDPKTVKKELPNLGNYIKVDVNAQWEEFMKRVDKRS